MDLTLMAHLHLHGIVSAYATPVQTSHAHVLLRCGSVSALVSNAPAALPRFDRCLEKNTDCAAAHRRILQAYCRQNTVIPLNAGMQYPSTDAVCRAVHLKEQEYFESLTALNGMKEFVLRIAVGQHRTNQRPLGSFVTDRGANDGHSQNSNPQLEHDRYELMRSSLKLLTHYAMQVEPAGPPKQGQLLDCVALMREPEISLLRRMIHDLHTPARDLGLDIVLSGPFPPYSCNLEELRHLHHN